MDFLPLWSHALLAVFTVLAVFVDFLLLWLHALLALFALFAAAAGAAAEVKDFNWSASLLPDGREEAVEFAGAVCEVGQDLA